MAEFQEVMRQWRRMCNCHKCADCPGCTTDDEDTICMLIATENQRTEAKVEHIITQWAAEHPEPVYPTWWDWLINEGVLEKGSTYKGAFNQLKTKSIPADIAEKLGIEPKAGGDT